MTAMTLADDLTVCVDCAMMSAYGELGQGDEAADRAHADAMAAQWPSGHVVLTCGLHCNGYFSNGPCGGCGSTLAGDRHPAVVFAR